VGLIPALMSHKLKAVKQIKRMKVMTNTYRKGKGPLRGLYFRNAGKKIPPYKLYVCWQRGNSLIIFTLLSRISSRNCPANSFIIKQTELFK